MCVSVSRSPVQKPEKLSSVCVAGALRDGLCAYTALHTHARMAAGHTLLVTDGASVRNDTTETHAPCYFVCRHFRFVWIKVKVLMFLSPPSLLSLLASCASSWRATTAWRFWRRHTRHRNTRSWSSFGPALVRTGQRSDAFKSFVKIHYITF